MKHPKLGSDYIRQAERDKREREERAELMASVNKVILVGNLGKDPELRFTQSGTAVCSFSVATTEKWTDPTGNLKEQTEWHKITVWKKQAENCAKYLKKGSSAFIEGRLSTRSYEDQGGQRKYVTEIVAENVKFLGSAQRHGHEAPPIPNNSIPDYETLDPDIPF